MQRLPALEPSFQLSDLIPPTVPAREPHPTCGLFPSLLSRPLPCRPPAGILRSNKQVTLMQQLQLLCSSAYPYGNTMSLDASSGLPLSCLHLGAEEDPWCPALAGASGLPETPHFPGTPFASTSFHPLQSPILTLSACTRAGLAHSHPFLLPSY